MASVRHFGIEPNELQAQVGQDTWTRWGAAEPVLNEIDGLDAVRTLRGRDEDRFLGALLRLACVAGGDDRLAAIAVAHQLGGSICSISRRYRSMTSENIDEIVAAAMWEEIRAFDWRKRSQHFGASLTYATRRAVRRTLLEGYSGDVSGRAIAVDPGAGLLEVLVQQSAERSPQADQRSAQEELDDFLGWAVARGHLDSKDVALLSSLVAVDRDNSDIPRWNRGACSVAAVEQVAESCGVSSRTVRRERNRVLERLRQAVPAYLDEVA